MSNWIRKHVGQGRADNVYLAALYVSKRSKKNFFATRTFSIKRDIQYVQVHVGYQCVFRHRRNCLATPEVYEYGSWVGELLDLAKTWHQWDAKFTAKETD